MVASEATPLAKAGGLADMISSLSAHLAGLGHDVRLVMPAYGEMQVHTTRRFPLSVKVGFRNEELSCLQTRLPGSKVLVYLLDHPLFSERSGIYGNKESEFFSDNGKRFALLSRAPFALMQALRWRPDILHAHDWPTALTPVYLASLESDFHDAGTVSVLTVHNIGHQGLFSSHDLHYTRLRPRDLTPDGESGMDELNFLAAGLRRADYITSVSPMYAREIQSPAFGAGLEEVLQQRSEQLFGILNGIDTQVWNPETDTHLPRGFSDRNLAGKAQAKRELQLRAGFKERADLPLIGMVTRLVEQKGFRELCGPPGKLEEGALAMILGNLPCRVIVLGTGEACYEKALTELSQRYDNLVLQLGFDEGLAHLIEGGSDLFLMPSRYEPCGLNQLYSLRYGTVPIVRRTGGLADTVIDYFQEPEQATGFAFDEMSPDAIFKTTAEAIRIFGNEPETIRQMQRRGMQQDFSWQRSAESYLELYRLGLDAR